MSASNGSHGSGRDGGGGGAGSAGRGIGAAGRTAGERPGRRALFSDPSGLSDPSRADAPPEVEARFEGVAPGRRAVFSSTTPLGGHAARGQVIVHCRTCLASTKTSWPALARALIPSVWLPMRKWPRLMRCPACHRVAWCRIEWRVSPRGTRRSGR